MTVPAVDGRCHECGFDYDALEADELSSRLERAPASFETLVGGIGDQELRRRPEPKVWSVLEYTCHVRDVLKIQRGRLLRALEGERPVFPRSGMWEWPERDGYNSQRAAAVLRALRQNAASLSASVREVGPDQWDRQLVYSYPEPTERSILWLIRHTAHEGQHHLMDVERILRVIA